MKYSSLLPLFALVVLPISAHALDCTKATSKVDRLICATPELKKADEAMSAAYFKLLQETTDPEFHEALIASQRRWLKVRSLGPDRFGAAEDDKTDDRDVLTKMTHDRLAFLHTAEPIRVMEQERNIMSKDSGGKFAGFRTVCVLQPPPYGAWAYECWGDTVRQHNDRVCSSAMGWMSGHMTEYRTVSVLKGGEPKIVATCAAGYDETSWARCPEPNVHVSTEKDAHWNTTPDQSPDPAQALPAVDLWKFDPDIDDPSASDQLWMHVCLFTATYPPSEASWPRLK